MSHTIVPESTPETVRASSTEPSRPVSLGARRRAERRSRVVDAAMELAGEGGYEAVQMRAVADRSGVALGTIYRYFAGKDDLLIAGLVGFFRLTRAQLERDGISAADPAERLVEVLDAASRDSDGSPVLMSALLEALATTDPSLRSCKLEVDAEIAALIELALGGSPEHDVDGIRSVISHVWFSALHRWVGGLTSDGSVARDLHVASRLLVSGAPR